MSTMQAIDLARAEKVAAPVALAGADPEFVPIKTWLAVFGSTLGAFLAVLNIQVVNSSIADIQGAIGAGIDTGGWVSTAYLVAEIIVIPLSGWLAQVFSLRRYLIVNSILFLLFSVAAAQAHDLTQMIVFRALQGFSGGVLIPLSFTIIISMLPKAKQPLGIAMFAFSATFAPAIGPTIGGWLNETLGWQYIFYVNLLPGLPMLALLWWALPVSKPKLQLLRQGDWFGIGTMAVGLAALQSMLEEGERHDWFGSPMIVWLAVVAALALSAFFVIELRVKSPLLNLRLARERNFGVGLIGAGLLGFILYGSVFVLPLYLSQVQGYNAMQIGEVLAWTGLPQLVLIPFMPMLMRRVDMRVLIAIGFGLYALSNLMNVWLTRDVAGPELLAPNVVRAVGQALVMTPLTAITTGGIDPVDAASASALFNMIRNLGGAIGIAILQTFITTREHFHSNILSAQISVFGEATRARIAALAQYFARSGLPDPAGAWHAAVVTIGRTVRLQAEVMGYADTFLFFSAVAGLALLAALFFRKSRSGEAVAAH